jgi:hypothetical protein
VTDGRFWKDLPFGEYVAVPFKEGYPFEPESITFQLSHKDTEWSQPSKHFTHPIDLTRSLADLSEEIVLSSRGLVPPGWIEKKFSSASAVLGLFDFKSLTNLILTTILLSPV